MQVFRLVALADVTSLDVVADEATGVRAVGGAKSVELLLCALMTRTVGRGEQLRPQGRRQGNKHMAAVHDEPVHHGPGSTGRAVRDFSALVDNVLERVGFLFEVVEDGELGCIQRERVCTVRVLVAATQGIHCRILRPGL